ncbi:class I SAM-dependent methyltransferase [Patescibacteria group bacterium]|nr:class I SAM-dependent methyltransferase [Patescibacteria group bacterium]
MNGKIEVQNQNEDKPWFMYDRLAHSFREISLNRKPWIDAINSYIIKHLKPSDKLIDIGAGDGARARNIADTVGINEIELVEPSAEMSKLSNTIPHSKTYTVSAESLLGVKNRSFYDAVLCLWNVLGHIPSFETRVKAIKNMVKLVKDDGTIFLDVNNRYNIQAYGDIAKNNIKNDKNHPEGLTGKNGDVRYEMNIGGETIPASGHVFTKEELELIVREAGATIDKTIFFDYDTGEIVNSELEGQILLLIKKVLT